MTDAQNIFKALQGERITTEFSLFTVAKQPCHPGCCSWRTIACDDEKDVLECRWCGTQRVAQCNFDDDCA